MWRYWMIFCYKTLRSMTQRHKIDLKLAYLKSRTLVEIYSSIAFRWGIPHQNPLTLTTNSCSRIIWASVCQKFCFWYSWQSYSSVSSWKHLRSRVFSQGFKTNNRSPGKQFFTADFRVRIFNLMVLQRLHVPLARNIMWLEHGWIWGGYWNLEDIIGFLLLNNFIGVLQVNAWPSSIQAHLVINRR